MNGTTHRTNDRGMWTKYATSPYGWMNTGHTAYGTRPADTTGERWVRPWEMPDEPTDGRETMPADDRRPMPAGEPTRLMRCG